MFILGESTFLSLLVTIDNVKLHRFNRRDFLPHSPLYDHTNFRTGHIETKPKICLRRNSWYNHLWQRSPIWISVVVKWLAHLFGIPEFWVRCQDQACYVWCKNLKLSTLEIVYLSWLDDHFNMLIPDTNHWSAYGHQYWVPIYPYFFLLFQ